MSLVAGIVPAQSLPRSRLGRGAQFLHARETNLDAGFCRHDEPSAEMERLVVLLQKARLNVFENSFSLFPRDAGKPAEKLIDARAAFEILEERFDRYSRAAKNPRVADFTRLAFHRGTRGPIQHARRLSRFY